MSHSFPTDPNPLFNVNSSFPLENRSRSQSLADVKQALAQFNLESLSDFHLLLFLKQKELLDTVGGLNIGNDGRNLHCNQDQKQQH
jgi:hypothetical protein